MEPFYAILAEDLYLSIIITYFAKKFVFLRKTIVFYSKDTGITKKRPCVIGTYQTWLLSYRTIINRVSLFINENIPEFSILLDNMELFLLKDFLLCRISGDLPIALRHQIFSLIPAYFSENALCSLYAELTYEHNMYSTYLDLDCPLGSRLKKLVKIIILYFKSFIS
jgi:hypothetical protein